jgi:hypothetical protein
MWQKGLEIGRLSRIIQLALSHHRILIRGKEEIKEKDWKAPMSLDCKPREEGPLEARKGRAQILPGAFRRDQLCQHLDFRLLTFNTIR